MGCAMKTVKKRKVRRARSSMNPYLSEATPEQRRWLKTHTLSDLEDIAEILEYQGENVDGIRQVISDLSDVATNLGIMVKKNAEHDLLEFVTAEEEAAEA
jgi:hypothetical protein